MRDPQEPSSRPRRPRFSCSPLRSGVWASILLGLGVVSSCAPVVRSAPHRGAERVHAHRNLVGPYDGQVVDAQSGEAIADATVVAAWDYDQGDGFVVPLGQELFTVRTDAAGRYRVPRAPLQMRGSSARLVSFSLSVSKPGYLPYRSDQDEQGQARRDFAQRNHAVALKPALPSSSAREQLVYARSLAASALPQSALRKRANLELYRLQSGLSASEALPAQGQAPKAVTNPPKTPQWLDAGALLDADGLRTRTGAMHEFTVQDLQDIERSAHYHGIHFRAKDLDVRNDFAYRVWFEPPEGLAAVTELLKENLPNAKASSLITEQSWTFENEELRAVAFVDPESNAAVLLTCGVELCRDMDTAVLVAHHLARNIDSLERVDIPSNLQSRPKPQKPVID